jgi:hypothetical protein
MLKALGKQLTFHRKIVDVQNRYTEQAIYMTTQFLGFVQGRASSKLVLGADRIIINMSFFPVH